MTDGGASLDRGLKDRKVVFSSSCSNLRKKLSADNWGKWILKSREFQRDHWHSSADFDQIVKKRVENSKQVKLAARNGNEREENLYTGEQDAEISVKMENGEWKTTRNRVVTMKSEERNEDFYYSGACSRPPPIPGYNEDFYYSGTSIRSPPSSKQYYNIPKRSLPKPPAESQQPSNPCHITISITKSKTNWTDL